MDINRTHVLLYSIRKTSVFSHITNSPIKEAEQRKKDGLPYGMLKKKYNISVDFDTFVVPYLKQLLLSLNLVLLNFTKYMNHSQAYESCCIAGSVEGVWLGDGRNS